MHAQVTATSKNGLLFISKNGKDTLFSFDLNKDLEAGFNHEKYRSKYAAWHFKRYRLARYQKLTKAYGDFSALPHTSEAFLKGMDTLARFRFTIQSVSNELVRIEADFPDISLNEITLQLHVNGRPDFFGGGEQFSHYRLNGKNMPFFVEEQGIGRGDQPLTFFANLAAGSGGNAFSTYFPVPFIVGSDGTFLFIENKEPAQIDLRKNGSIKLTVRGNSLRILLGKFDSFQLAVNAFNKMTGPMPVLPESARGTVLGIQGGKEKVLEILARTKASENPVTAIWIQDWCGKRVTKFGSQLWWKWQADETLYPDFKQFCADLSKQNISVWGYINPYFADEGPLYEEFKSKGYFVKNAKGLDYRQNMPGFPFYTVDLTNPDARSRMKEIIRKNMIEMGLGGWMADFGEWLPLDAKLHDGSDAYAYHNRFPEEWAKLNREAISEAGMEGEIVFFCRSGYSESAKYAPLFWMGDQTVNFGRHDGLPSTVPALLSSSVSGMVLNHSDVGGYTSNTFPIIRSIRKRNVLYKWAELNAFTPVLRTHEGLVANKNAQVYTDTASLSHFARMGKLHYALAPYFKALEKEYAETGAPIIRPLNYAFEQLNESQKHLEESFMLGDGIYVYPVLKRNKKRFTIHLPPGKWYSPSDLKQVLSGKIKTRYKTGYPLVFFSHTFIQNPANKKVIDLFAVIYK